MAQAVAIALKNMMGLVCDPVAGLVEVPCVKRNVTGAVNAISAAELALAGIESRIPTDEVIDAMRAVGEALPSTLRETGRGGVAASPTAVAFRENFSASRLDIFRKIIKISSKSAKSSNLKNRENIVQRQRKSGYYSRTCAFCRFTVFFLFKKEI